MSATPGEHEGAQTCVVTRVPAHLLADRTAAAPAAWEVVIAGSDAGALVSADVWSAGTDFQVRGTNQDGHPEARRRRRPTRLLLLG